MKALKSLKYFLAITVIFVATACHPEDVTPRQENGDSQTVDPIVND